jgi:hypothetical protein
MATMAAALSTVAAAILAVVARVMGGLSGCRWIGGDPESLKVLRRYN